MGLVKSGFQARMLDPPEQQDEEMPQSGDTVPLEREPFEMQFYHFVPVFRFYVIVKEKEADDIEAIFWINSLSSFTLGVAQIIGIMFHIAVLQQPLSIFHMINIISQGLNWPITILYFFANPAVTCMKRVVKVDAMKYNDRQFLREMQKKHAELMRQYAMSASGSGEPLSRGELNQFCAQLDHLILGMANCKDLDEENFKLLDIDWKFSTLQRLVRKGAKA